MACIIPETGLMPPALTFVAVLAIAPVAGIHPKTHKKYWVFDGTEQLNNLLTEWKLRKN